jgi:septal ring factor EnvC (AmiA/AmiB activator)
MCTYNVSCKPELMGRPVSFLSYMRMCVDVCGQYQSVLRDLEESRSQYEKSKTTLTNSQQKAEALQGTLATLQSKHAEIVRDRDQLSSQVKSLSASTCCVCITLRWLLLLDIRLLFFGSHSPRLPGNSQLEEQIGVFKQSVGSLGADVAALRSQVTALTQEAASFADERDEWQAKYNSAQDGACVVSHKFN